MSASPTLTSGGLTPAGRTDVTLGAASTLPTLPEPLVERESAADVASVVPHVSFRHGLRALDEADWRNAPADLDLAITLMPGYGVATARMPLWQVRDGTNRYAFVGGLSLEGGVFGNQGRDLMPAFGVRVPLSLTASFGSVIEAWLGAQVIAVYVSDSDDASVFGGTAFVGLAAGVRNFHALFEIQGGPISPDWFSGPWRWHWTPSFSLRYRL